MIMVDYGKCVSMRAWGSWLPISPKLCPGGGEMLIIDKASASGIVMAYDRYGTPASYDGSAYGYSVGELTVKAGCWRSYP